MLAGPVVGSTHRPLPGPTTIEVPTETSSTHGRAELAGHTPPREGRAVACIEQDKTDVKKMYCNCLKYLELS